MPLPWPVYLQAPSHLRKWRAISRFQRIATSKKFRDAWLLECGGDGPAVKRFLLKFPPGVWDIPWELLIGELDSEWRERISIVRGLPDEPATLPSRFDRPMSILVLQGDDGSRSGRTRLDLSHEFNLLKGVYDSLPAAHRQSIAALERSQPTAASLASVFDQSPDVVFFSGHGSSDPPAFFLVDGTEVTPERISRLIESAPARPVFAAFWACDTARQAKDSRSAPGPPFYTALAKSGVASVLAMQAPVTDLGCIFLAQEVFQALAGGDALDVATARARSVLLDARETGAADNIDWACPVVWSSGLSAARLAWNSPSSGLAQLQASSRRARLKREGRVFVPPNADEIEYARRFTSERLCWIKAVDVAGNRERWIRILLAIQVVLPRYVVAVEFNGGQTDTAEGLMAWAEDLQQTLETGDAQSGDFRSILELIRHRPKEGWKRLCAAPDVMVSIWRPPQYGSEEWFWYPLITGDTPVNIVGEPIDPRIVPDGWSIEELDMQLDEKTLDVAYSAAPFLSNALALLSVPVPRSSIEMTGNSLDKVPQVNALVIETPEREVVLAASAARSFRKRMDKPALTAAHGACMRIFGHTSFGGRLTPATREHRLTHCLGAEEDRAAVAEASALLMKYRELDRPRAVVGVMRRLGGLWRELPENLFLTVAWADVMLGDMAQAKFWLERASADSPLESAWNHGLRAEIYKAGGEKLSALDEVDAAIGVLQAVPAIEMNDFVARRLRAYRQDRARILQYLFYELELAGKEYQQLLDEWQNEEAAAIDVAVVLRNYAECIRFGHQHGEAEWDRSKEMLSQAQDLLKGRPDLPLFAEVLYEKARIAISETRADAADMLDAARSAARTSGYLMLLAICNARYFWQFEVFDLVKWKDIEADLSAFPRHGWAVRTLIDGRLRAAKRISDAAVAQRLVLANLEELKENPSFDAGSDRIRIAASAAGSDLLAPQPQSEVHWNEFLSRPWAPSWLAEKGFHTSRDVWEGVS
jgi:tetratricopeptide (TPR) repeat protein